MAAHIIDSAFLKDLYGTAEMRAVFEDQTWLQKGLDVEVALAQAEAEVGLVPAAAAAEIERCARVERLDWARLKHLIDETVHPIVPLIRVLAEACADGAGEYVHWGATTQDILDSACVLQVKDAVAIFERRLTDLSEALARLAETHRDTLMAGRTHGQHALPITFGFKAAVWLAEVRRHQGRLEQLKPRVLVGQFAGAVGTLASVAPHALEIQSRMLARLQLSVPVIGWHTARDRLAEFAAWLGLVAATAGKLAHEVVALQRTEVAEVEEPFHVGKVGSSTMPHKRNPMLCEAVVALARLVMRSVPVGMEAMLQEHERDWTGDHLEWAYLPEMCILTDGALSLITRVLAGLHVYPDRMQRNLNLLDGQLLSEAVMLALAARIGRQAAHDVVYACAMRAVEERRPFRATLSENPKVAAHLTVAEIDRLLDPAAYTGLAGTFVDRVLADRNG